MTVRTPYVKGTKAQITVGLDLDQLVALERLADARRCKKGALVRQAVDLFLAHNSSVVDSTPAATAGETER